jgi:hypothetical protein
MTTSRISKLAKTPALLVVALALAVSASGCIIDDSGGTGPGCYPDLTLSYVIIDNATGTAISCAAAGADTVRVTVNGYPLDYDCTTGAGVQTLLIPLDYPGDVGVYVELFGNGQSLSHVNQGMTIYVGCNGYVIPDPAELPVVL